MSDLVTLADFDAWLGGAVTAENTMRQAILDQVEAAFESACLRTQAPFSAALTGRIETHDGTGTETLWIDYPIAVMTEVKLGTDPAVPDETLDHTNRQILVFAVGSARLVRTDGGEFGDLGSPGYVRITYNTQADLPADAKLAVLTASAAVYRRRNSEGVKSETAGPYSITYFDLDQATQMSPTWADAVRAHTRLPL